MPLSWLNFSKSSAAMEVARWESHDGRLLPIVACCLSHMSEFLPLSEPFMVGCLRTAYPVDG